MFFLLFVYQVILTSFRVHNMIQLERYLVQITPLAAQEFVYTGRAHHISQHNRSVVHVVQVTNHVLVVQMHLWTQSCVYGIGIDIDQSKRRVQSRSDHAELPGRHLMSNNE